MGRMSRFTETQQREIKADLWGGMKPADVGRKWDLSGQYVHGIKIGSIMATIPWPDGSTGAMGDLKTDALKHNRDFVSRIGRNTGVGGYVGNPRYAPAGEAKWREILGDKGYENLMEAARSVGCYSPEEFAEHETRRVENERHALERQKHELQMAGVREAIHARWAMLRAKGIDLDAPREYTPVHQLPINPNVVDKVDWEFVERRYGDHPLVALAKANPDDVVRREAIRIVFMDGNIAKSDECERIVVDIEKRINKFLEEAEKADGSAEQQEAHPAANS